MRKQARYDRKGKIVLMAEADGYVMLRRPGCMPFVKTVKEWNSLWREPPTPAKDIVAEKGGDR